MKRIFTREEKRIDIIGILNHPYVKNAPRKLNEWNKVSNNIEISNKENIVNYTDEKCEAFSIKNMNNGSNEDSDDISINENRC